MEAAPEAPTVAVEAVSAITSPERYAASLLRILAIDFLMSLVRLFLTVLSFFFFEVFVLFDSSLFGVEIDCIVVRFESFSY